jgi:phosphinothricin acetyltransferase
MAVTIRLARDADAREIAPIYGPFCESTPVSFEVVPPTRDEMAERIRQTTMQYPWLVLEDHGAVAGYAYASRHRDRAAYVWAVDKAVYVSVDRRRCGVGRALYAALFDLLRLQGYFKACAGITLPNPASIALHEAAGFRPVGTYRGIGYKQGVWHDVAWLQATLQPERSSPPLPLPVPEVVNAADWQHAVSDGLRHYGVTGGRSGIQFQASS